MASLTSHRDRAFAAQPLLGGDVNFRNGFRFHHKPPSGNHDLVRTTMNPAGSARPYQFSLQGMFGLVTLVSVIFACSPLVGIGASASLSLMAVALALRHGLVALACLALALLLPAWPLSVERLDPLLPSILVALLGFAIASSFHVWRCGFHASE
jgi:hypothetical protein